MPSNWKSKTSRPVMVGSTGFGRETTFASVEFVVKVSVLTMRLLMIGNKSSLHCAQTIRTETNSMSTNLPSLPLHPLLHSNDLTVQSLTVLSCNPVIGLDCSLSKTDQVQYDNELLCSRWICFRKQYTGHRWKLWWCLDTTFLVA